MVLLDGLGQLHHAGGNVITQVPQDVVMAAIRSRTSQLTHSEVLT
jgi:hypothetical protein